MNQRELSEFGDEAKRLHALDPNRHKSDATTRSANFWARKTGEILEKPLDLTANYLGRLACLDENGPAKERYLHAITNSLIVQPEDISQNRWRAHIQKSRDRGYVPHNLDANYFGTELNAIQGLQKDSLRPWVEHISEASYPMWFKVYALEGLARLGTFHSYGEGAAKNFKFDRRRKDSFAPFPRCNPETLQTVYDALTAHYDGTLAQDNEESFYNGSFNHLYAQALRKNSVVVELPAAPEDVQGEWIHYGDYNQHDSTHAQKLMDAAADNWCISSETYAKNFLNCGAEFYLFHLKNPDTHQLSSTATIAIRMIYSSDDKAMIVEEVSGANNGPDQDIHEVLAPMANETLYTLAGGAEYLEDIRTSDQLSVMDRKWQRGEAFTIEELELLYEVHDGLGRWAYEDVRVQDFRQDSAEHEPVLRKKYGEAARYIVLNSHETNAHIPELLERGVAMNLVINKFLTQNVIDFASPLLKSGVAPEELIRLVAESRQHHLVPALHEYGYDCSQLIAATPATGRVYHIESFRKAGITVDIKELVYQLHAEEALADTVRAICPYVDEVDLHEVLSLLTSSDTPDIEKSFVAIRDVLYNISADALRNNADAFRSAGITDREIAAALEIKREASSSRS